MVYKPPRNPVIFSVWVSGSGFDLVFILFRKAKNRLMGLYRIALLQKYQFWNSDNFLKSFWRIFQIFDSLSWTRVISDLSADLKFFRQPATLAGIWMKLCHSLNRWFAFNFYKTCSYRTVIKIKHRISIFHRDLALHFWQYPMIKGV